MYDVIIVGGGPAGLNAALYAKRYGLKTLLITKTLGGTVSEAHTIENYLGFEAIKGIDLIKKFISHIKKYKVDVIEGKEIVRVDKKTNNFVAISEDNKKFTGKAIILATGMKHRQLNIPGEKEFFGKGVSYCYTCDAPLFKNKVVAVVGGGDSAIDGSLVLSHYAKKVYIIYRSTIRAEPIAVEKAKKNKKIEFIAKANVKEIYGNKFVNGIKLDIGKDLIIDGIFIQIGLIPIVELIKRLKIKTNERDFIISNDDRSTNVKGIFAAGDIVSNNIIKQIITAAADGATAALSAYKYLKKNGI